MQCLFEGGVYIARHDFEGRRLFEGSAYSKAESSNGIFSLHNVCNKRAKVGPR